MKQRTFILFLLLFVCVGLFAQSAGDYRSKQTGYWGSRSSWQRYYTTDPAGWKDYDVVLYPFNVPTNVNGVITIQAGHVITVANTRAADQLVVEGSLLINSGRTLSINDGSGTDLFVSGLLEISGNISNSGSIIVSGSILDRGGIVGGIGSFELASGALIETRNIAGLAIVDYDEIDDIYYYGGMVQCEGGSTFSEYANYIFSYGYGEDQETNGLPAVVNTVVINHNGGADVILASDLTVTTKFTYMNGEFDANGLTLTYSPGATLEYAGDAIGQDSDDDCFPSTNGPTNVIVNNPYGVDLHANRTISGNLSLTQGAFNLASNVFTVNGTTTKTGGSISGGTFITDGYIDAAQYISIAEDGANVTNLSVTTATDSGTMGRAWIISGTDVTDKNITFYWTDTDDGGYPWSASDQPSVFVNGIQYFGTYDVSGTLNSLTITDIPVTSSAQTYSGTSGDGGTLPVELSAFTAIPSTNGFVRLDWITQSETGVQGFYIYRNTSEDLTTAAKVSSMITATNTSTQTSYTYIDNEISSNGTYYYWLQNQDIDGETSFHGPATITISNGDSGNNGIPMVTSIYSPYPNPFNPEVTISYGLATDSSVSIRIYNTRGQLIRTLFDGSKSVGNYQITWNGMGDNGMRTATGIYYVKMDAGKYSGTKKITMIK